MYRLFMLTIAAVPLIVSFKTPVGGLTWWTTHALDKVRPNDPVPASPPQSVSIAAARNEFEPFQIVLRSGSERVDDVDVAISDLRGPHDAVISNRNVSIYFEGMVDVRKPSNGEGRTGEWPDPLIPRTDRYYGERRNAFPFRLSENRNQAIWVEVYVPVNARPGNYSGEVFIDVHGRRQISIPVKLEVWNFGLPSTSSLPNTYGFSGLTAVRQHYGKYTRDDEMLRLTALYQKAALLHRISIHGGSMAPPHLSNINGRRGINWEQYDAEVGPFLDGTVIPSGAPLAGAKATTTDLRTSGDADTDQLKILYWREFAEHFKKKGWFSRLFNYVWDEPRPSDFAALLHKAQLVHTAEPDIRNLVTAPLTPAWSGAIDIWSPLINCFEVRSGFQPFCEPVVGFSGYQEELQKGRDLWWYQSCASHGCNSIGGAYFTGWPSDAIDTSPVANRIMEWMSWKYGIHGELYYSMTEAYTNSGDAWKDVYRYGGNGDGTLFYPGTPDRIGGKTHIPIDSIRLKLIREGLEDYEYLDMLGPSPVAHEAVDGIVHKTFDFEHDPSLLYAARRRMGEELDRLGGASRQ
jgi:Glycoside hydrolase 123, catalytic domain/Glycoside hydrolase 123 N-terminal domain